MAITFYVEQTGFTSGEVSPAVGNRTDLEKFPYALAKAENCYISPYGPVTKRQGTTYVAETKYSNKRCIFDRFIFTQDEVYLLEIGDYYIRVYYKDTLVKEIETPFSEQMLSNLRFNQSQDVLLITSGIDKPYTLSRYSHTDWKLEPLEIDRYPLDAVNSDEENTIKASNISGTITLTSKKDLFDSSMEGTDMEIVHDVPEESETINQNLSSPRVSKAIYCKEWRVKTSGFWKGTVIVERSKDQKAWTPIRTYKGLDDTNVDESGINEKPCFIRLSVDVSAHNNGLSFSGTIIGKPYTSHGLVRITRVDNARQATGTVTERLGSTEETDLWKKSYWGRNKYPKVACFWQDRLWFAGPSEKNPNTIWGSRSGDYTNFSVERVGGDLTDDSACIFPLITREAFSVNWLIGGQDLLILADAVEYRVNGDSPVTPRNFQASVQSGRGSNNCKYQFIGNQIVFVQRRGGTVREMGFEESQNSYTGDDLTILAKHLVEEHEFIDSCYLQEPHSMIYYVRDDGVICCLAYIKEQKVYAWSTIQTDGMFETVASIPDGYADCLYTVVKRTVNGQTKRYIEKLEPVKRTQNIYQYNMMDCIVEKKNINSTKVTGLSVLAGKRVQVLFTHDDGLVNWLDTEVGLDGTLDLPYLIHDVKVGIPFTTKIVTLNVEQKIQGIGTIQGKEKQIVSCNIRLDNSYGGSVGQTENDMTDIQYMEQELTTGDMKVDIGGERNQEGRLYIYHNSPTPFTVLSLVREVSL